MTPQEILKPTFEEVNARVWTIELGSFVNYLIVLDRVERTYSVGAIDVDQVDEAVTRERDVTKALRFARCRCMNANEPDQLISHVLFVRPIDVRNVLTTTHGPSLLRENTPIRIVRPRRASGLRIR